MRNNLGTWYLTCPLCTHMSKSGKVLKTCKTCNNFHNKNSRQLQSTQEVTLIGAHIVSKLQLNPTIIAKVIDNFVHGNFFQDHCIVNCTKIKPYGSSFQDHPFGLHVGHTSISFKTIVLILHLSRPYLVLLSRPLHLVYF